MKTFIFHTVLTVMALFAQLITAQEAEVVQEDFNIQIQKLEQKKETIISEEKQLLKQEVEVINEKVRKNEITKEEAKKEKEKAAKLRALNIENRIAIIENQLALMSRNGSDYFSKEKEEAPMSAEIGLGSQDPDDGDILFGVKIKGTDKKVQYDIRTHSNPIIAFGFNNAIAEGQSLQDLDYKMAGSRFFELGYMWTTRVFKNTNFLRVKYGLSYHSNGLKPTDNRYFVAQGDQTNLETFDFELEKSKFRLDHLVLPIYFELGASKKTEREDRIRFQTHSRFRFGFGGYAGFNIGVRQKLKYTDNEGIDIKDKIKRDFNTNDLIYGVGSYIGFGDAALYVKYDISPIFENAEIDQNNVSLGVRFDFD